MTKPKHAWMVRAGDDNELADLVVGEMSGTVAAVGHLMRRWEKPGVSLVEPFRTKKRAITADLPADVERSHRP